MMGRPDWYRDGALHFALGVEDTFVPQERAGERAIDEYALTEHDARWHADLGLAVEAGAELLRWGVPWYRIEPKPGTWEWSWLDRVMDRFAELGLRPIVDLMHYGTPSGSSASSRTPTTRPGSRSTPLGSRNDMPHLA